MGKKYTTDEIEVGGHMLDASMMTSLNTIVIDSPNYMTTLPSHNHDYLHYSSSELTNTNLDTISTSGVYQSAGSYSTNTNIPYNNYFTMLHLDNAVGRAAQLWFGDSPGRMYYRPKQGVDTWHPWEHIITSGGITQTKSGILESNASFRAPIFYDSNNTGYYVNPASTSNLNGLTVQSTITGTTSGNWSYSGINAGRNILLGTDLDTDLDSGGTFSSYGSSNTSWNAPQSYGGVVGYAFSAGIKGQQFFDIRHNNSDYSDYWFRSKNNLGFTPWAKVWHNLNDGAGSGLDADTVDGVQGGSFIRSDENDDFSGVLTGTSSGENLKIGGIRGTAKGSQTGQYIHLYERVHIGGPSGWGAGNHGAPGSGLSTWGSANFGMSGGGVIQLNGTTVVDVDRNGIFNNVQIAASIQHAGDTNTWFGFDMGSDIFRVVTNGTERYRVDNDGTGFYGAIGLKNTSSTSKHGIDLYGGAKPNGQPEYGMMFTGTSGSGTSGDVTGSWATYFTMNGGADRGWIFKGAQGNTSSISSGGVATFNSAIKSPVFYDSNNTGYYVNPAGTSNLNTVNALSLNVSGNTTLGNGNGDVTHINDVLHIGATDSGNADLFFGEGSTNSINYGAHFNWDSGYRFTWSTRNNGTDAMLFYYDTNNTTYLHWGRHFHMGNKDINYVNQLHFTDNVRFYDDGNDNYLNFKYGDANYGGIRIRNGADQQKGFLYAGNDGFGLLDSDGNWALRTQTGTNPLELRCDNNIEFQVHSSYTLSPGSSRAPIFYDSDNTGYYVDPASTTRLNLLTDYRGNYATHHKQSSSDFPNGTLVTTDINANVTSGDSYIIEVTGKSYDSTNEPFSWIGQGYIYNNTIINHNAISQTGVAPEYMKVFKHSDNKLAFWWPRYSYWNSFEVRVRRANGSSSSYNAVTSIANSAEPSSDKKVQTNIAKVWTQRTLQNVSQLTNDSSYLTSLPSHTHDWYSGVTNKPAGWLDNNVLIQSKAPGDSAFPSGFYESYQGTGVPTGTWFNFINVRHSNAGNGHGFQAGMSYYDNNFWFRSYRGGLSPTFQSWETALSSGGASQTKSGILQSNASLRAPIFYDSNDTAYYVNPASTSNLNSLNVSTINRNPVVELSGDVTGSATMTNLGSINIDAVVNDDSHKHSFIQAGGAGPSTEDLNAVADAVSTGQLSYRGYNSSSTNKPPASDNANGVITVGQHSGTYNAQLAFSSDGNMYWRDNPGTSYGSWQKIWTDVNDGSGSGLDADKLDGHNSGQNGANVVLRTASNGYLYVNNWIHPANSTGLFYDAGVHFYETGNYMYSSTSLQANNDMRAPVFYDRDNTGYYVNPAGSSKLNILTTAGAAGIGGATKTNRKLAVYGHTLVDGTLYLSGASTTYSVEVGQSRSTEGVAYLDLTGEVAPVDFGLRMIRYGGLNAESKIIHKGTGALTIDAENSGDTLFTNTDVGIGTTNPSYKLDVSGTIRATGDVIAYSDARVKENIKTIPSALDKVSKLRGVEFNKIGESDKSIGVIAQEIEKIIPEVVKTDKEGMKAVAYGNITGLLIEAIKEQQKQIEELKKLIK